MKSNKQNIDHMAVDLETPFPGMAWIKRCCLAEDILENMGFEIDNSIEVQHGI
jgi:hypothetical protein